MTKTLTLSSSDSEIALNCATTFVRQLYKRSSIIRNGVDCQAQLP